MCKADAADQMPEELTIADQFVIDYNNIKNGNFPEYYKSNTFSIQNISNNNDNDDNIIKLKIQQKKQQNIENIDINEIHNILLPHYLLINYVNENIEPNYDYPDLNFIEGDYIIITIIPTPQLE